MPLHHAVELLVPDREIEPFEYGPKFTARLVQQILISDQELRPIVGPERLFDDFRAPKPFVGALHNEIEPLLLSNPSKAAEVVTDPGSLKRPGEIRVDDIAPVAQQEQQPRTRQRSHDHVRRLRAVRLLGHDESSGQGRRGWTLDGLRKHARPDEPPKQWYPHIPELLREKA